MIQMCTDSDTVSILYVEDEPEAREMVSRVLVQEIPSLQLYAAENGSQGLTLYQEHRPDIVITDINMPVLDGIRMGNQIKSLNPEAIIIAVTAHSDTGYLLSAIETGISNYVLKPIDYDKLFAAIAKGLETVTLKKRVKLQNAYIRQLSRAVEENPCSVVITNSRGVIEYVNPMFTKATGYSSEEAIGQIPRILQLNCMPQATSEELWSTITSGRVWRGEFLNQKADGMSYWESASISPIYGDQGSITHFVAVTEDITERRRAEETIRERDGRLRRAEEMAHLGHWRYSLATGQLSWSDEMYRIFGLRRDEKQPGLTLKEITGFCHPDDLEQCIRSFDPSGRDFGISIEYRIVLPDGVQRHLVSNGELVVDEYGNPVALFGTLLDTTELRQKERELQEKGAELERLTYTISHDMKSPLVTIKTFLGYLELDLAKNDAGRIEKDVHFIRTATDRLWHMLNELLEMLRIGRTVNQPVIATCGDVVEEALSLVAGPITERGVELVTSVPHISLYGDRPRLVEVWQNLVENACKFMGDQPNLRIEIGSEGSGPGTVFFVRDNGIGIESQYQGKVFGLFEKLNQHIEGTGLGLALVKRIVELHGGTIEVNSPGSNQGACFRFTLPKAVRDETLLQ